MFINYQPPKEIRALFIAHYAPLLLIILIGPLTPLFNVFNLPGPNLLLVTLGILIIILGYSIFIRWSIFWQKTYHGQLVTHGIFKYVRHPHYSSLLILGFGLALFFTSTLALFLAIISVPLMLWSAIDEEQLLKNKYGKKYEQYLEQVPWRFIPKLL